MAGKGKEPAGEHQIEGIVQPGASITCKIQPTSLVNFTFAKGLFLGIEVLSQDP